MNNKSHAVDQIFYSLFLTAQNCLQGTGKFLVAVEGVMIDGEAFHAHDLMCVVDTYLHI